MTSGEKIIVFYC